MKTIVSILNGDCIKSEHSQENMFSISKENQLVTEWHAFLC